MRLGAPVPGAIGQLVYRQQILDGTDVRRSRQMDDLNQLAGFDIDLFDKRVRLLVIQPRLTPLCVSL